ncbi:MAG: chromosomal replication initiator protein, partial [Actinomycetota bacterium]|nr:chromosomal replication initiator protein [Actinomycetota bacterium]
MTDQPTDAGTDLSSPAVAVATPELEEVWARALEGLSEDQLSPQHRAWVALTRPLGLVEDTALLAAPNEFAKDVLESRLRPVIADALSTAYGREIRVAVTVQPSPAGAEEPPYDDPSPYADNDRRDAGAQTRAGDHDDRLSNVRALPGTGRDRHGSEGTSGHGSPAHRPSRGAVEPARLNPKYSFETFVIGASNRFAHAAAVAVAEAPAKAYNPLFVYGESGLGKTHLLHAIGHYAQNLFAGARVRYVSSEEFTNDFINSLRDDKAQAFQRRYRDVDILLVDDIQFL